MPARLLIAFADDTYATSPTFVDVPVAAWTIEGRGRQYELDRNVAGTATAVAYDTAGLYDFLNAGSPLAGDLVPLRQAQLQEWDPVASSWQVQFTGFVENFHHAFEKRMNLDTVTFDLVDILSLLANTEVIPSTIASHLGGSSSTDSGYAIYARDHVDDRLRALAADAGLPAAFTVFFTGNVDVKQTKYPAGSDILTAMQEAADAEFPGVANLYADRAGNVSFHGRKARFDPVAVAASAAGWDFKQFQVGDVASAVDDGTWAIPSELEWDVDEEKIINACLASPERIKPWQLAALLVTDAASIAKYGTRVKTFEGLLTAAGDPETMGGPVFTARQEALKIGQYYVANYKDPQARIERLTFTTPPNPLDATRAHQWKLLLQVDISDLIVLTTANPGGGGFNAQGFFVEGIRKTCLPAAADYDELTVELDVSPQAFYTDGSMFGF